MAGESSSGSRRPRMSNSNLLLVVVDRAPALIAAGGKRASYRFFEFFTANIT